MAPSVRLSNKHTINVTSQEQLPMSEALSQRAQNAMILPGLKSASLISLGQLCDDNCNLLLNKRQIFAIKTTK